MPASFTLMTCALRPKTRLTTKMAAIPMMTVSQTHNGTFMHKPPAIRDDVEHRRSLPPAGLRPRAGGAGGFQHGTRRADDTAASGNTPLHDATIIPQRADHRDRRSGQTAPAAPSGTLDHMTPAHSTLRAVVVR